MKLFCLLQVSEAANYVCQHLLGVVCLNLACRAIVVLVVELCDLSVEFVKLSFGEELARMFCNQTQH